MGKHPEHVRKRFALVLTIFVGLLLIVAMVIYYKKNKVPANDTGAKIKDFYNGIIEKSDSIFSDK